MGLSCMKNRTKRARKAETQNAKKKKTEFREVEKNQIMQGFKDPK